MNEQNFRKRKWFFFLRRFLVATSQNSQQKEQLFLWKTITLWLTAAAAGTTPIKTGKKLNLKSKLPGRLNFFSYVAKKIRLVLNEIFWILAIYLPFLFFIWILSLFFARSCDVSYSNLYENSENFFETRRFCVGCVRKTETPVKRCERECALAKTDWEGQFFPRS